MIVYMLTNKDWRIICAGHVARTQIRNGNTKRRDKLGDLDADGRVCIKQIFAG
jgi:hypothetical protein